MDPRQSPLPQPPTATDQGGRYSTPEEGIIWRAPMQPPQLPQPGYQPQPSGQRPPEKQVIASNPLNPFNANLRGFIQDWLKNPKGMGSELWESYSSASPGMGVPGGGVPGAIKSALPTMGLIGRMLNQTPKLPAATNMISQIIKGPAATELESTAPKAYNYLNKIPEKFFWDYVKKLNVGGKPTSGGTVLDVAPSLKGYTQIAQGAARPTAPHEALHSILGKKFSGTPHGEVGAFPVDRSKQIYDFYQRTMPNLKSFLEMNQKQFGKDRGYQEAAVEALARNMLRRGARSGL